jgi:hypothetical protein
MRSRRQPPEATARRNAGRSTACTPRLVKVSVTVLLDLHPSAAGRARAAISAEARLRHRATVNITEVLMHRTTR